MRQSACRFRQAVTPKERPLHNYVFQHGGRPKQVVKARGMPAAYGAGTAR